MMAITTAILLIIALAAMGTIAWLTATDSKTNTFTVGTFNEPEDTTDPEDPDLPDDPDNPDNPITPVPGADLSGYLIEPSWSPSAEHKLIASATFEKDPYVGIGDKSEEAVVYVYVDNPYTNKVHFTLNGGWSPVEGYVIEGSKADTYQGGLFEYTGTAEDEGILSPNGGNAWTCAPVFSTIVVADDADEIDLTAADSKNEITVSCFIHQAKDADGVGINRDEVIEPAAIEALNAQKVGP